MTVSTHTTKSIKLSDDDFQALKELSKNIVGTTFRDYCENLIRMFVSINHDKNDIRLLSPPKSAGYRPIALNNEVTEILRVFAKKVDASANIVVYTAFKEALCSAHSNITKYNSEHKSHISM
jgi:hypothetical protein